MGMALYSTTLSQLSERLLTWKRAQTEWGFAMNDNTTWKLPYTACLAQWLPAQKAGWMLWALAGSYYIRSGTKDYDETWGLLTHDWSTWRNPTYVQQSFIPMVKATIS